MQVWRKGRTLQRTLEHHILQRPRLGLDKELAAHLPGAEAAEGDDVLALAGRLGGQFTHELPPPWGTRVSGDDVHGEGRARAPTSSSPPR